MEDKTVDVKFHVINDGDLEIDKGGLLEGTFFFAAGARICYDLNIVKFMNINACTFKLIYPDIIPAQTKKIMTLRCSNRTTSHDGVFSADQLPSSLVAADALVHVDENGNFPMIVSNISETPSMSPILRSILNQCLRKLRQKLCGSRMSHPLGPLSGKGNETTIPLTHDAQNCSLQHVFHI